MNKPELGRLERVKLREAWSNEAGDFTPWLAVPENLRLLEDTLGIELVVEALEKRVGPYRADIVARDPSDGDDSFVLIENQLERTDHIHLGQLLTYAAGLDAVTIVWLADRFTDEHRAALDWLNGITGDRVRFFGLEIELWRIGESHMAPKLNIVSKPNNWTTSVRARAREVTNLSQSRQLLFDFWTSFRNFMEEHNSIISSPEPVGVTYRNFPIGRSGFGLSTTLAQKNRHLDLKGPEIHVALRLRGADAKTHFALLENQRKEIEDAIGYELLWDSWPATQTAWVYTRMEIDHRNRDRWPECFEWLHTNLEAFHHVFEPRIQESALPTTGLEEGQSQVTGE